MKSTSTHFFQFAPGWTPIDQVQEIPFERIYFNAIHLRQCMPTKGSRLVIEDGCRIPRGNTSFTMHCVEQLLAKEGLIKTVISKTPAIFRNKPVMILCPGIVLTNENQRAILFLRYHYGSPAIEYGIIPADFEQSAANVFSLEYKLAS